MTILPRVSDFQIASPDNTMKKSSHSASMVTDGPLRFSVVALADVERIHELSLRVLAETGILLHYPPARAALADHGASVDEARQVVRIPRQLVEQALAVGPAKCRCTARPIRVTIIGCAWMARVMRAPPPPLNWIVDALARIGDLSPSRMWSTGRASSTRCPTSTSPAR